MGILHRLAARIIERVSGSRAPDAVIGGHDNPYLLRWWVIPRNRVLNVYLHQFLRDDDDRALHDHPWFWCSIILSGAYAEQTIAAGGIHRRRIRRALSIRFGTPWGAHRVELLRAPAEHGDDIPRPCWTLFITGPRMRTWGFHCPERGWIPWKRFVDPNDPGAVGPGCDEQPTALQQALRRIEAECDTGTLKHMRVEAVLADEIWPRYVAGVDVTADGLVIETVRLCHAETMAALVAQHCPEIREGEVDGAPAGTVYSGCLRANANAMRELIALGRMREVFDPDPDGRVVYATWENPSLDPFAARIANDNAQAAGKGAA